MSFLKNHYTDTVQPDLLLTGVSSSVFTLPRPVKIILILKGSTSAESDILCSSVVLELIAHQKPRFRRLISGGGIYGSSLTLRDDSMYHFLSRLLLQVLPRLKQFEGLRYPNHSSVYSFMLRDLLLFEGVSSLLNQEGGVVMGLHCEFYFNTIDPSDIMRVGRLLTICFQESS